jgi:hypothetical protein
VRDPHRPQAGGEPRGRPIAQGDRARRGTLHGVDLRDGAVVEIPDPDEAFTCSDRPGTDPDRGFADDRVRARVDDAHVVRVDPGETVLGASAEEKRGRDHRHQYGCGGSEHRGSAPPGAAQCGLGGLRQVGVTPHWRKVVGQAVSRRLVETHRTIEVLESLLAEVAERDVKVLLLVLEQGLRRLGNENLPAVPGRADTRGPVHREARIAAVARDGLARVKPHANLDLDSGGPLMRAKGELALHRGEERISRARERNEERVALGIDLVAVVSGERRTQQIPMVGEHGRIPAPKLLDEARGALDVREEERHCSARLIGHRRSLNRSRSGRNRAGAASGSGAIVDRDGAVRGLRPTRARARSSER